VATANKCNSVLLLLTSKLTILLKRQGGDREMVEILALVKTHIGELDKLKEYIKKQTDKRDALRKKIKELNAQMNLVRTSLEEHLGVQKFEPTFKSRTKKLNKLKSDIASLKISYIEIQQGCDKLKQEAQQYQVILEQKSKADEADKLKLLDEQVCIMKGLFSLH
jgi:uncharacterized coiled-coil DUF342 family protein